MSRQPFDSIAPLAHILPLRAVIVTLEVLEPIQTNFFHHVSLNGWIRNFIDQSHKQNSAHRQEKCPSFADTIMVEPLENGHLEYQPKDLYRFRITATAKGEQILANIIEKLKALPGSAIITDRHKVFRNNLKLYSLNDSFTSEPVQKVHELCAFGIEELAEHTQWWQQYEQATVQFTTPAIVGKLTDGTKVKGNKRYCRDKQDWHGQLFSTKLADTYLTLLRSHTHEQYQRVAWPTVECECQLSIWLNQQYGHNPNTPQTRPFKSSQRKDLSGAMAILRITNLSALPRWLLAFIVLGQYLGLGQSRVFGMGRYQLLNPAGETGVPRPSPCHTLLNRYLSRQAIRQAYQESSKQPNLPKTLPINDQNPITQTLTERQQAIFQQCYQPSALEPVSLDKADGTVRQLYVPDWADRVLQRCVASQLAKALDPLWATHSYGYRKHHSRHQARDQLNHWIKQGYVWALESDIQSFFDNV
ncbi:MAG: reverse transcriptase domain-containing protein, partial [Pontibacterium sp.]